MPGTGCSSSMTAVYRLAQSAHGPLHLGGRPSYWWRCGRPGRPLSCSYRGLHHAMVQGIAQRGEGTQRNHGTRRRSVAPKMRRATDIDMLYLACAFLNSPPLNAHGECNLQSQTISAQTTASPVKLVGPRMTARQRCAGAVVRLCLTRLAGPSTLEGEPRLSRPAVLPVPWAAGRVAESH